MQAAPPHVPALGVIAGLSFSHGSDNAVLHPSLLTSLKLILRFLLLVFFLSLLWVALGFSVSRSREFTVLQDINIFTARREQRI